MTFWEFWRRNDPVVYLFCHADRHRLDKIKPALE